MALLGDQIIAKRGDAFDGDAGASWNDFLPVFPYGIGDGSLDDAKRGGDIVQPNKKRTIVKAAVSGGIHVMRDVVLDVLHARQKNAELAVWLARVEVVNFRGHRAIAADH